jgi:hypothetical protein
MIVIQKVINRANSYKQDKKLNTGRHREDFFFIVVCTKGVTI